MVRTIIIKRTAGNANPRVAHAAKKAHRRKQPVVANPARQQRASARVQRLIAHAQLPVPKDAQVAHSRRWRRRPRPNRWPRLHPPLLRL